MSDAPDPKRLKQLEERIAALKKAREPKPGPEEHYSAASQGWRMVIELVAGLGIGFGIGYGIDVLLGTLPWFLLLFTLLGFVAGVKTMLRTATEIQNSKAAEMAAKAPAVPDDEDEGV
jgi:ATP synthase protein I